MREPGSLTGDAGDLYRQRKRDIAATRAHAIDALLTAQGHEREGNIDSAACFAEKLTLLADDLYALYDAWARDVPMPPEFGGPGSGSTSLVT